MNKSHEPIEFQIAPVIKDIANLFGDEETILVPLNNHIKDDVLAHHPNLKPINIIHSYISLIKEIERRKNTLL